MTRQSPTTAALPPPCRARWRNLGRSLILAAMAGMAAAAEIPLASVTEASGGGAVPGTSFKNGVLMAVAEINAKGGVLGQKLALTSFDIPTSPDAAKDAMAKAVAGKPFAVLGPVFSGITAAVMPLTAEPKIPFFTGGEAATLTQKFHPTLLRTSLSQLGSAPRIAGFITYGLALKKIALLSVDNAFGQDGRKALSEAVRRRGAEVVVDLQMKPGQKDLAAIVAQLKGSAAEGLLLYVNENEAVDALKALKAAAWGRPIVADGLVAAEKVLEAAGPAAEGVYAHMNLSWVAPSAAVQGFVARYQARYGSVPDQNGMKGYTAVQTVKAGIESVGKVDAAAFIDLLKSKRLDNRTYPELLSSISYDYFGDIDRDSYYVLIHDGAPQIIATVRRTEGATVDLADGRQMALDSADFRNELKQIARTANPARKK